MKFVLARTAWFIIHMLKLWFHYASLDKFYNLHMWIFPGSLYSKVRVIFAMRPVHLYGEKFVFSITARYVIHKLKLQGRYASFDKFYNLNMSIVLALLYSKFREIFCYSACTFVWEEFFLV